ncbi:hypothetical protein RND81_08G127600 [Saponaria officinalis]|uniref:MULE transposase domain-containing protein n=1 Tax=Saponaria officinalis TaxID=3572 RepID=A0AAW1J8B6_SAPOF
MGWTLNINVLPWMDDQFRRPTMDRRLILTSYHGGDDVLLCLTMDSFEEFGGDEVDYNPLFATTHRFSTRGEAYEWAQNVAYQNGFALVKVNSGHKNRSQPELVASYFRCSRYGSSKVIYDPEKPKKKSKTVKCQCLFRIRAVENYHFVDNKQKVMWNILTAKGFGYHNHLLTKYKDGHRHFAGLNEEEKAYVRQQYLASALPRDIKSGLHQKTPDKPQPSSSQIYTETTVEANYVHWHEINPDTKELTHVFMSHPEAVKLFRAYPHVVLIDSTYKTNTYNMALVEVVGVTPAGSSFLITCVLIPSESEEGYTWLLRKLMEILECTGASPSVFVTDRELGLVRTLRSLFPETPHLLCRCHVNRAIESRALMVHKTVAYKHFVLTNPETGWWNVIDATCEEDFNKAWTWLKSAHLTLDTMWSRIHSMLEGQHSKIRKELEDSMSRSRITHRLFSLLQGKVSTKAIEIMEEELKRGVALGIGLELRCGCVLRRTHGIPCACALVDLKNSGSRVHLSDIHSFLRTLEYENSEAMPKNDNDMLDELIDKARQSDPVYRKVFLEKLRDILHPEDEDILAPPVRENPKGRPRWSTTRNKSGFEHTTRKYGTPSTDASTNVQHMVGDFGAGVAGAPLEKNYTKGLFSTWVKRYGVPEDLWPVFDGWVDVGSDGHCGFRVLSHALRGGEEDYIQMRDWCLREITWSDVYKGLFEAGVMTNNGMTKYENTLRRIRFIHQSPCGDDHWMSSDDLGPPEDIHMPPLDPSWIVFREQSVKHLDALYKTNIKN